MSRHPAFNHLVEQHNAIEQLSLSIATADYNIAQSPQKPLDLCQPLLLGAPGLGKTELALTYANSQAARLGCDIIRINTPRDIRNMDEFNPIFDRMLNEPKKIIYIDECHEMEKGKVAHGLLLAYLRASLDRQNTGKHFQVGPHLTTYDRSTNIVILSTNHPDKVDDALKSRCQVIDLVPYTPEGITQITQNLLEKHELTVDSDKTLNMISVCGRGTARPIVNLLNEQLLPLARNMGMSELNSAVVLESLRLAQMYPSGLSKPEIDFINSLKNGVKNRRQIESIVTSLDGQFPKASAFLQAKGFVHMQSNGMFYLTDRGTKYIRAIGKAGFLR
jgi:Holliday junction resolvasome RuvABC ATP-dependent DNA helicase subunit